MKTLTQTRAARDEAIKNNMCSFDGCGRPIRSRGLCNAHSLQRQRGQALRPVFRDPTKKWTFIAYAAEYTGDECLTWPFGTNSKGYARHQYNEGDRHITVEVHRIVCERVHGAPPSPSYQAAHSCGRGHFGCINGKHLSWKTRKENERDKIAHGTCNRGEHAGSNKLKQSDINTIRTLLQSNTQKAIAAMYGVSRQTICSIARGVNWRWLPSTNQSVE